MRDLHILTHYQVMKYFGVNELMFFSLINLRRDGKNIWLKLILMLIFQLAISQENPYNFECNPNLVCIHEMKSHWINSYEILSSQLADLKNENFVLNHKLTGKYIEVYTDVIQSMFESIYLSNQKDRITDLTQKLDIVTEIIKKIGTEFEIEIAQGAATSSNTSEIIEKLQSQNIIPKMYYLKILELPNIVKVNQKAKISISFGSKKPDNMTDVKKVPVWGGKTESPYLSINKNEYVNLTHKPKQGIKYTWDVVFNKVDQFNLSVGIDGYGNKIENIVIDVLNHDNLWSQFYFWFKSSLSSFTNIILQWIAIIALFAANMNKIIELISKLFKSKKIKINQKIDEIDQSKNPKQVDTNSKSC